jgi:hypothetical protein
MEDIPDGERFVVGDVKDFAACSIVGQGKLRCTGHILMVDQMKEATTWTLAQPRDKFPKMRVAVTIDEGKPKDESIQTLRLQRHELSFSGQLAHRIWKLRSCRVILRLCAAASWTVNKTCAREHESTDACTEARPSERDCPTAVDHVHLFERRVPEEGGEMDDCINAANSHAKRFGLRHVAECHFKTARLQRRFMRRIADKHSHTVSTREIFGRPAAHLSGPTRHKNAHFDSSSSVRVPLMSRAGRRFLLTHALSRWKEQSDRKIGTGRVPKIIERITDI